MEDRKRFRITDERVLEYLERLLQPYDGIAGQIGSGRTRHELPTADTVTLKLLEIFIRILNPGKILEIGTSEGRSAIVMAGAMIDGTIDTIESDYDVLEKARANFDKAGVSNIVNIIAGDANDVLSNLNKEYDLIFIDAAKGQYTNYYDKCSEMVSEGGVIFADNVLYRGMVAGGAKVNRRQQLLVRRLGEFLEKAVNDKRFVTDVLPVGDGVCISYRKREGNEKD